MNTPTHSLCNKINKYALPSFTITSTHKYNNKPAKPFYCTNFHRLTNQSHTPVHIRSSFTITTPMHKDNVYITNLTKPFSTHNYITFTSSNT